MTVKKVFLSLLSSMALCAASAQSKSDASLIFYLPFDGDAAAVQSAGDPKPVNAKNLSYGEGIDGKAVLIGQNSLLEFLTDKNLRQDRGTVMMYFKPVWDPSDVIAGTDKSKWHCLFSELRPEKRAGSGALWFWIHGSSLRADTSDVSDSYIQSSILSGKNEWVHLAFTWDGNEKKIYINGKRAGGAGDGHSPLDLKSKSGKNSGTFKSFFVGTQGGREFADGFIDEFKIYDAPLSDAAVAAEAAKFVPASVCLDRIYFPAGKDLKVQCAVKNESASTLSKNLQVSIVDASGKMIQSGEEQKLSLAPGEEKNFSFSLKSPAAGEYKTLAVFRGNGADIQASSKFWVLSSGNEYVGKPGALDLKLIETIDFSKPLPKDRFSVIGESSIKKLGERGYLEGGINKYDRFAVKVTLPQSGVPYVIEFDYPDDKVRTMEVIMQSALDPANDYDYQTGVFCGDEYPNSGKILTHRSVYWGRSKDCAILFTGARENAPAAVSAVRVYELKGGLPDANVKDAAPVNGWNRVLGIYNEDCAISYDFGMKTGYMPDYDTTLDRLMAYMKWSGQNMLTYPAVWYQGRIEAAGYNPRGHAEDFIRTILTKFENEKLEFMPTINFHNIELDKKYEISEKSFNDGSLYSSPVMILKTGKPNPGGWHGTPPSFNPMHPEVRKEIDGYIDSILNQYADSPAFKGIILHLTKHTTPWFGSIDAGYNDYCIDGFEKDTGIKVAVDRKDPLRGKLYYEWLMANARDAWIDWRCKKMSEWYKDIAKRISAKRPDLKLGIFSYNHTVADMVKDERSVEPGFSFLYNRESGFDPKYYQNDPSIIFAQTIYPADYRWAKNHHSYPPEKVERMRLRLYSSDVYESLLKVDDPWVNMHDRYWESAVAGAKKFGGEKNQSLDAPWLKETHWRVSTLNPNVNYCMEQYLLPLRYSDILGFTKGGFLIGTLGMESQLADFSRAFRALPAVKFSDVAGKSETLRVRSYKAADGLYFYVANTGDKSLKVSLNFASAPGSVTELATSKTLSVSGTAMELEMKPFSLKSFKAGNGSVLKEFK